MSGYSRWDQQPALGRRGMVLAVVIPVLIAASAFGVVALVSRDSEPTATTVRVPTSEWIPGQGGGQAMITGVLAVDDRRCIHLEGPEGPIWPIWPAGFRGKLDEAGHVTLYDGGDNVVGRDGDRLEAAGSYSPPAAYAGEPCVPDEGEIAIVQSEVERVD